MTKFDGLLGGTAPWRRRQFLLSQILLAGIASLCATTAMAQSHTIYTKPLFLWHFSSVQDCGYCANGPGPYETSLAQAWSDAQGIVDQTSANNIWTAQNLITAPNSLEEDWIPLYYYFGVQSCSTDGGVTCRLSSDHLSLKKWRLLG